MSIQEAARSVRLPGIPVMSVGEPPLPKRNKSTNLAVLLGFSGLSVRKLRS